MSRSFKHPPGWLHKTDHDNSWYQHFVERAQIKKKHLPRVDTIAGRGGVRSDVHWPSSNTPKGYNTYMTMGTCQGTRKWAKRSAAKVLRRQGRARISELLRDDYDAQQEAFELLMAPEPDDEPVGWYTEWGNDDDDVPSHMNAPEDDDSWMYDDEYFDYDGWDGFYSSRREREAVYIPTDVRDPDTGEYLYRLTYVERY